MGAAAGGAHEGRPCNSGRPCPLPLAVHSPLPNAVHASVLQQPQVACGDRFTLCAAADGRLYAWGLNERGQLGLGGEQSRSVPSPTLVPTLCTERQVVVAVAAGPDWACAVTESGQVASARHPVLRGPSRTPYLAQAWCWGNGECGQLGSGNTADAGVPGRVRLSDSGTRFVSAACGGEHLVCVGD